MNNDFSIKKKHQSFFKLFKLNIEYEFFKIEMMTYLVYLYNLSILFLEVGKVFILIDRIMYIF